MMLYCSGELDGRAMADFERHMQECPQCAREYKLVGTYDDLLKDAFEQQPLSAEEIRKNILAQISQGVPASRFSFRTIPRWAVAAAAAALVIIFVAGVWLKRSTPAYPLYSAAIEDHLDEVVLGQPRKWRESQDEIETLAQKRISDGTLVKRLCPPSFRLMRARLCDLDGQVFVHFVYSNGDRSVSFFARANDDQQLREGVAARQPPPVEEHSQGELRADGFRTDKFTLVIVSDLPASENLRLAREASSRVG